MCDKPGPLYIRADQEKKHISVNVAVKTVDAIDAIATRANRSRSYVVDAMLAYAIECGVEILPAPEDKG